VRLADGLTSGVGRIQRQLEEAAAAEDVGSLAAADATLDELLARLATARGSVVPAERADAIARDLRAYHALARATTEGAIRGRADLTAALQEMTLRYTMLRETLEADAGRAHEAMSRALERTRVLQRRSVVLGAAVQAIAAGVAGVLALLVALAVSRRVRALTELAARVSEGDLEGEADVAGSDELAQLGRTFGKMTGRLRGMVRTLQESSAGLAAAASQLGESTRAQVGIVERVAAGVAETGVTTRELEQNAARAVEQAENVLEVARRAQAVGQDGEAAASGTVAAVEAAEVLVSEISGESARLLERAEHIEAVVETVRDLAAQSQVLSFNASLEAVRAGEAGKAFALVAAEVRSLAEGSDAGAERIARILRDIQGAIRTTRDRTAAGAKRMEGSARDVRESGHALERLGAMVRESGEAAREIAGALQQQSTGIVQIASAMRDIDAGMSETVARVEAVEAAARELTRMSEHIAEIAAGFRLGRA